MSQATTAALSSRLARPVRFALGCGRRFLAFLGPATLISVGYIDPGNWATDLEGGSRFGYRLLWVLVGSSFAAILLQSLSGRLGLASGRNLAQACRECYDPCIAWLLWILAEVGIVACDAAEVMGSAIALNMLFGIPLLLGALLTTLDVLVILVLRNSKLALLEACVAALLAVVALCLAGELFCAPPAASGLALGLMPALPADSLYVAIGILGATLMPHNLYLQSALVQRPKKLAPRALNAALRRSWLSTAVALNLALLLNIAILTMSAVAFSTHHGAVTDLREAHRLLSPLLGASAASLLFAVGLLCSGQSATITGTLAGQVVMEGFLKTKLSPGVRRVVTRTAAVVPALIMLTLLGGSGAMRLLIASQVVLSLQLPFAVVPLLRLTNSRGVMGAAVNHWPMRVASASCAAAVCLANALLLRKAYQDLQAMSSLAGVGFAAVCGAGAVLLAWISFVPLRTSRAAEGTIATVPAEAVALSS